MRRHRFCFYMNPQSTLSDDLRRRLRIQRLDLTATGRQAAAQAVAGQVAKTAWFVEASIIAGYWACHGELDPAPLLERAWAEGKSVYLPVLVGDTLQFAPYHPTMPLRRNRFHIPEPEVSPVEWLPPEALDLALTPLVAFDLTGTRLGMGGGFYDRSFAFRRDRDRPSQQPRLVGLAYEFQRVEMLVRQPWDVPLDALVTEKACYVFA